MGGCFSSESTYEEAGRRPSRVRPSDDDGAWPCVGERDVDRKAKIYIDSFHGRQQSGCAEVPPTPAPATAAA